MLPDARRSNREKRGAPEKFNLDATIQVRPVNQHGDQFIATKRLDDLHKCELICTDGDGLDAETLPIFLAPFVEFVGRLGQGYDVDREPIRGENHAADFPCSKMARDEKDPFAFAPGCLKELETAPL